MSDDTRVPGAPVLIPEGTSFAPDDITFYYGKENGRTLDEALAEATILVSCPHSGDRIPAELAEFLAPEFTHRLQYDFTDRTTGPIVRRWAALDPRIIYVENPHPRLVRDPNREKPDSLVDTLREAFARVSAAGPWNRVDLTGVDAIRPVTFSFYPLLVPPTSEAELERLADTFAEVAERGLGVYERTRDDLLGRMVDRTFSRARAAGSGSGTGIAAELVTLSFHDTMNHTTTREGAVSVDRAPADRLPNIVALSNRGDAEGNPRGDNPVTMDPQRMRLLANTHRQAFNAVHPDDVQLNQPYLGSNEIVRAGARFRGLATEARDAGVRLGAVQAEFLREFLLGGVATRELMEPGVEWPSEDVVHTEALARACARAWSEYSAL